MMYSQIAFIRALKAEQERNQTLVRQLEHIRSHLPAGHLCCKEDRYYHVIPDHGTRDYIRIPEYMPHMDTLIHQLKEKGYIKKALPVLKSNLHNLTALLASFQFYDPAALAEMLPAQYQDFDYSDLLLPGDVQPEQWRKQPYAHNMLHPQDLKYRSGGGLWTRSKAEADIATKLEEENLAFRYEPKLILGRHIYYPDFCILHPLHRRQIYWEHFGKMDDPEYQNETMDKLRVYAQNGYTLGDNLIMTWETLARPLNFIHIKDRIHTYFLE